jgi:HK97 gp10 family phage protein
MITIDIKGFETFEKLLKEFPLMVEYKCLKESTRAGAHEIRKAVLGRTPIRQTHHPVKVSVGKRIWRMPGYLYKSLKVMKAKYAGHFKGVTYLVVFPSKWAFYARFVEKGTSKKSARPFMRPAFDTSIDKSIETQRKVLGRAIAREWKKFNKDWAMRWFY